MHVTLMLSTEFLLQFGKSCLASPIYHIRLEVAGVPFNMSFYKDGYTKMTCQEASIIPRLCFPMQSYYAHAHMPLFTQINILMDFFPCIRSTAGNIWFHCSFSHSIIHHNFLTLPWLLMGFGFLFLSQW